MSGHTVGITELMTRMQNRFGNNRLYIIEVGTGKGIILYSDQSGKNVLRTANDNAMILAIHKRNGRDPCQLSPEEIMEGQRLWLYGINESLNSTIAVMALAGKRLGDHIINAFKNHFQYPIKQMKQLKLSYQRLKRWRYGEDLPVLVATGQLMMSLYAEYVVRQ